MLFLPMFYYLASYNLEFCNLCKWWWWTRNACWNLWLMEWSKLIFALMCAISIHAVSCKAGWYSAVILGRRTYGNGSTHIESDGNWWRGGKIRILMRCMSAGPGSIFTFVVGGQTIILYGSRSFISSVAVGTDLWSWLVGREWDERRAGPEAFAAMAESITSKWH